MRSEKAPWIIFSVRNPKKSKKLSSKNLSKSPQFKTVMLSEKQFKKVIYGIDNCHKETQPNYLFEECSKGHHPSFDLK